MATKNDYRHECPDWDFLEITIDDLEWECCTCKRELMDREIKKGFEKVKKTASKQEASLVKKDKVRDKKCEHAEKMAKRK